MFGEVFTVVCALLGIIGLMFLAFYASRWLNKKVNSGGFSGAGQKAVRIIECTGIAPDKQLMIIMVGKRTMLIGVTPNAVNKICDLDEEDVYLPAAETVPAESGFMQSLKRAFAEKNAQNSRSKEGSKEGSKWGSKEENEKDDF